MMKETEDIVHMPLDFLPLKTAANIVEGNALRLNWNDIINSAELSYIMGNPPFSGARLSQTESTVKQDMDLVFGNLGNNYRVLDYVSCWYIKAAQYMQNTRIMAAFVSTNSITQGEQVEPLWNPLTNALNVEIVFAYRTFKWTSEAHDTASVHCVIIGFTTSKVIDKPKKIYTGQSAVNATNISPYLVDAPTVLITSRKKPLCDVPEIVTGNAATDDGLFFFSPEEYEDFIQKEPESAQYFRVAYNSHGFINNKKQYCLWLVGVTPDLLSKMPHVLERVKRVREYRLSSSKVATQRTADTPTLFTEIRQPSASYIVVPKVSSENRRYIPLGFFGARSNMQ